ncbi:MAG TPA: class I SAM-dependent methyltransferase, partial [Polyangiaceae bacterium]|nr:class I SAM-dependent methyltransferase [Polyangiaceae bacterium]
MKLAHYARQFWLGATSRSSGEYWERRYGLRMTSGPGSYGALAAFKAEILNGFVRQHRIESVLELGCGDGNQLALAEYPRYLGLDVSKTAIDLCVQRF